MIPVQASIDSQLILRRQLKWLAVETLLLAVCFYRPLFDLFQFTLHNKLFSYIPLIPIISAYLIWTDRKKLTTEVCPSRLGAVAAFVLGGAIASVWWLEIRAGWVMDSQNYMALMTLSFLCFFWGACLALPGWKILRDAAFPVAFLVFAVPMPTVWVDNIETFFQYTSAFAAEMFFAVAFTPCLRDGLLINLPGTSLMVAPECSGIHSTLVLFITSLLAAYMFLRRPSSRLILALSIVPLAILRNGFRIFVIGELCVHISPTMIDSPIHRKGGPLFFALSLIPLFFLLVFLRKRDFNELKLSPNKHD